MKFLPRNPGCFHRLALLVALFLAACTTAPAQVQSSLTPLPTVSFTALPATATPAPPATATPAPTPTPCAEPAGRTESIAVVHPGLSGPLQARVHLPPCYDASGKTRYPVLYLLHGQGFTSDQWQRLGFLEVADRRALTGGPAFITVLPGENDTALNPFDSDYDDALVSALVPRIDVSYRTCAQRACRAIGGLSRGASWAVWIGLRQWGQFGVIGAHSFPPFHGLDRELPGLLASIAPGQLPRLYLDIGADDPYRAPAAAFEELLNQANVPHEWYLNPGGHDETYWQAHAPAYVAWYAAQFTAHNLP